MKKLYVLFVSFFLIIESIYSQNINIQAKIDSCINIFPTQINFVIKNNEKQDYWLNTWNLFYSLMIIDSIGREVMPHTLIEEIKPEIEQFILLKGKEQVSLIINVDCFNRFPLEKDKFYYLKISYFNNIKKDGNKTVMGKINIPQIKFKYCKD